QPSSLGRGTPARRQVRERPVRPFFVERLLLPAQTAAFARGAASRRLRRCRAAEAEGRLRPVGRLRGRPLRRFPAPAAARIPANRTVPPGRQRWRNPVGIARPPTLRREATTSPSICWSSPPGPASVWHLGCCPPRARR